MKEKLYKIGKYLLIVPFFLILIIGIFTTDKSGKSPFMENFAIKRFVGIYILLFGLYNLFFNKEFAQEQSLSMAKFLQNKPKFLQRWWSIAKSYRYCRTMYIIGGTLFVIFGIIFLMLVAAPIK